MAEGNQTKPDKIHSQRLVKILEHIAECLGVTDARDMYHALALIVTNLKQRDEDFKKNVQYFVKLLIFKPGVSANLLKQAVRGILIIKEYPQLVAPIYDMLLKKFPPFATMGRLDDESFRAYLEALLEGKEKVMHIRLMVVGMFYVGKTCLVRRICNESIGDVNRTVGIDVSLDACKVNKTGKWIKFKRETSQTDKKEYGIRLANIKNSKERQDTDQDSGRSESREKPQSEIPPTPYLKKEEIFEARKRTYENLTEANNPGITNFKENVARYYSPSQDTTVTAETENPTERETTVSIWDFAGQSIYYSTHHFFLNPRSIYLLVLDISKNLDEKVSSECTDDMLLYKEEGSLLQGCLPMGFSRGDAFRFWINNIYTYTHTKAGNKKGDTGGQMQTHYCPKIVLVATFKDKLSGMNEKEKEMKKDEFFRDALKPFGRKHPVYNLICKKKFLVSCTEYDVNVFDDLRRYIYKKATKQFKNEYTPAKWIPLERTLVAHGSPYITFSELAQMNEKTELPLTTTREIKSFLGFQHLLGNVLYYNVQKLDKSIVLKPQWIIDIFKLFVTHQRHIKIPEVEDAWQKYIDQAILDPELIQYILRRQDSEHVKDHAIEFMKHLDVMANPVTGEENEPMKNFFIVPCMLKKITREDANSTVLKRFFQPNTEKTSVLGFVFENGFLPPTVFHRLLASCIREWEICENNVDRNKRYLLYEGFGVFKLDDKRSLTLWYAEYMIFMRIAVFSTTENTTMEDCKAVKDKISTMLQTILLLDWQKRSTVEDEDVSGLFNESILCEEKLKHSVDYIFKDSWKDDVHKVSKLKEKSSFLCQCVHHTFESHKSLKYWYPKPTDRDLAELSDCIGKDVYGKLVSLLKLNPERVKEIEENTEYTIRTKSYKILIQANNEKYFTYDDLRKIVRDASTTK